MKLDTVFSYLVHPGKGDDEAPKIKGTRVAGEGKLFEMLKGLFDSSQTDCPHEIAFRPSDIGEQKNECRDLLMAYVQSPKKGTGGRIAKRLQAVTTHRSGLGLLFLMLGAAGDIRRVVVSRFPADSGIVADELEDDLNVAFIERVFMKSATAYKSVVYEGSSVDSDFWTGRAIDKQISSDMTISAYWIREFLMSDFKIKGALGTRRLALALKQAMNTSKDPEVRGQLASAARLAPNLDGQVISGEEFATRFGLTEPAMAAFRGAFASDDMYSQTFQFTSDEFRSHVRFRSIELDNGAHISAGASDFEAVFVTEQVQGTDEVRYTTQGRVMDDRLRKGKP